MNIFRISLVLVLLGAPAASAAVLFAKPFHVTRSIDEPLGGTNATVEQYYFGNRVVSIRESKTVIVDYDRRDITEIDRAAATYSVTKFEDVAAARPPRAASASTNAKPSVIRGAPDRRGGRAVETFTAEDRTANVRVEIAVDPSTVLSRDAFDVVVGAAYPGNGGMTADIAREAAKLRTLAASAKAQETPDAFGLPIEQVFRWNFEGTVMTSSNKVLRVSDELPPPDLIAIPAGAKLVDSHLVRAKKIADEVDAVPAPPRH